MLSLLCLYLSPFVCTPSVFLLLYPTKPFLRCLNWYQVRGPVIIIGICGCLSRWLQGRLQQHSRLPILCWALLSPLFGHKACRLCPNLSLLLHMHCDVCNHSSRVCNCETLQEQRLQYCWFCTVWCADLDAHHSNVWIPVPYSGCRECNMDFGSSGHCHITSAIVCNWFTAVLDFHKNY